MNLTTRLVVPFVASALALGLCGANARAETPAQDGEPTPLAARAPGEPETRLADPSNAELVEAARRSPQFRREWAPADLARAGLQTIRPVPGVAMDFERYVAETSLDHQPQMAALFDARLTAGILDGPPIAEASILELEDRLIVDRRLTIPLVDGACAKPGLPEALSGLCFTKKAGTLSKEMREELAQMRSKLGGMRDATVFLGSLTVADIKKMADEQLLDLLLNSDDRTIHHVSIVPRLAVAGGAARAGALRAVDQKLAPGIAASGLEEAEAAVEAADATAEMGSGASSFPRTYFLTGFTYGREIEDRWQFTFADPWGPWGPYYVRVDYHIGFGFGLRAPFAVNVSARPADGPPVAFGHRSYDARMTVKPIDMDQNGNPVAPAVGLPSSQIFRGREFVLELKASCRLKVAIPFKEIVRNCPSIDADYSRDVDPVIGSDHSTVADWWLNGSTTGLGVDFLVASASIDIGLGVDVRNGEIGARLTGLDGSQITPGGNGNRRFKTTNPIAFTVTRGAETSRIGIRVDKPTYKFDVRATPKLRARIGVDVEFWEGNWVIGPYPLDFLAVEATFRLTRHPGTVAKHDFEFAGPLMPPAKLP